jgi:signal peptidase I
MNPDPLTSARPQPTRRNRPSPWSRYRGWVELILTIAIAAGLAFLVQAFVVKPYRIPSSSMVPTLEPSQRILVNRLDTKPGLYDVVVFHPPRGGPAGTCGNSEEGIFAGTDTPHASPCDKPTPGESDQTFVKRVVGLPGDTLSIHDGLVTRNGTLEKHSFITACGTMGECTFTEKITVPKGEYFMMGDNRGNSDDSRYWGPVPQKYIIGAAFFTYWPIDRIGTL